MSLLTSVKPQWQDTLTTAQLKLAANFYGIAPAKQIRKMTRVEVVQAMKEMYSHAPEAH